MNRACTAEAGVPLVRRRAQLTGRLDRIRSEQRFGVWRGTEAEVVKLERAVARIDRKTARGKTL